MKTFLSVVNERTRMLLVGGITLLVYANSLANGFTYDDEAYILHNQAVKSFSFSGLFHPLGFNNVLRPITFLSFAMNWAMGHTNPLGYHLLNILLHAGVTLMLYLLLRTLLESRDATGTIAFVAALLYAVHPIHTEAVASIAGRSELLAVGFGFAAWYLHLRERPFWAVVCLGLALLSKESAVVFVPLIVIGDYLRGRLWLPRYGWLVGVMGVYLVTFWKVEGYRWGEKRVAFLDNPLASLPAGLRILNALRVAWKYMALQIYPARLSYDYSYNAISLYSDWRHAAPAVVGVVIVVGLWIWTIWTRRNEWVLAGALYLGGFAVTANILMATGTIMGERLAYLSSAGFCLSVALLWMMVARRDRKWAWTILSVLVLALAVRTTVRNQDWRNDLTLYSAAMHAVPGSAKAHFNLGSEFDRLGHTSEARAEYANAIRIYPEYPEAIENSGLLESRLGHDQDAQRLLETAVSLTPSGSVDHGFMTVNLAWHLIKTGQTEEALRLLNGVIARSAVYSPAWSNRAVAHYQRREVGAARSDAEAALRLDPGNGQAQALLSVLNASIPPKEGVSPK
jgi:Flp pilus assembly protein TadD